MAETLINARVRNFPYHRKKKVKTTNGFTTTNQTFMPGEEVTVSQTEFDSAEHILEKEEQYQARQPKTTTNKTKL